mgnify:CR=1 FL=1
MLIPFNRTVQGVFWWYPRKVVPLHRHSEKSSPSDFLESQELLTIPSLLATHYTLLATHYTLLTTHYSLKKWTGNIKYRKVKCTPGNGKNAGK